MESKKGNSEALITLSEGSVSQNETFKITIKPQETTLNESECFYVLLRDPEDQWWILNQQGLRMINYEEFIQRDLPPGSEWIYREKASQEEVQINITQDNLKILGGYEIYAGYSQGTTLKDSFKFLMDHQLLKLVYRVPIRKDFLGTQKNLLRISLYPTINDSIVNQRNTAYIFVVHKNSLGEVVHYYSLSAEGLGVAAGLQLITFDRRQLNRKGSVFYLSQIDSNEMNNIFIGYGYGSSELEAFENMNRLGTLFH